MDLLFRGVTLPPVVPVLRAPRAFLLAHALPRHPPIPPQLFAPCDGVAVPVAVLRPPLFLVAVFLYVRMAGVMRVVVVPVAVFPRDGAIRPRKPDVRP